jgi:hypothetical protein
MTRCAASAILEEATGIPTVHGRECRTHRLIQRYTGGAVCRSLSTAFLVTNQEVCFGEGILRVCESR